MSRQLVPGDSAPEIQSQAVRCGEVVDLCLDEALKGAEYLLLVFYPADFTFVCPTEIVQFTEKYAEFEHQRCNIVCCSTDSVYTHLAWLKAPKSERGLGATNTGALVLLSDRSHEISRAYGVLAESGAAYRGTFLIDKSKTVCQVTINDMPVGRSVDDALRMLTELRKLTSDGEQPDTSASVHVNSSNAQLSMVETSRKTPLSLPKMPHRGQPQQLQQQQRQLPQVPEGHPHKLLHNLSTSKSTPTAQYQSVPNQPQQPYQLSESPESTCIVAGGFSGLADLVGRQAGRVGQRGAPAASPGRRRPAPPGRGRKAAGRHRTAEGRGPSEADPVGPPATTPLI